MAGIVHFSEFFKYMEAAEHAFFRSMGLSINTDINGHHISWPRVATSFEFHQPLRFEDHFAVTLTIEKIGKSSLTYKCEVMLHGELMATGRTTSVCCEVIPRKGIEKAPIPTELRAKFEHAMNG
jgi:4-hydroxybenzoyl-CoA thioesterase/acyl-CoA thioester hydrolase